MWRQQISFLPQRLLLLLFSSVVFVYIVSLSRTEQTLFYVGKIHPVKRFNHAAKISPAAHISHVTKRDILQLQNEQTSERVDKLEKRSAGLKTPIITVFTTWLPSMEKDFVYTNTLRVWASLKPYILPIVFTNNSKIAKIAKKAGWRVIPPVRKSCGGIPILKEMYLTVAKFVQSPFYCFANADMLLNKGFVETALTIMEKHDVKKSAILLVGKRIDVLMDTLSNQNVKDATEIDVLSKTGNLSWGYAVDYFVTNRKFPWKIIPDLVIGRPVYDNWLVSFARKRNVTVIDGTATVTAVHQKTRKRSIDRDMCNKKLLLDQKLMRRMPIDQGLIECTQFVTRYSYENEILIMPRMALLKECKIWQ